MADTAEIRSTVMRYIESVGRKPAAEVAALYAEHATLEDPAGSAIVRGRNEIEAFYRNLDAGHTELELLTLRIAADTAVFHFRVTTRVGDQLIVVDPIDVMTFDDEARITGMRAFWGPQDVRMG